MSSARRPAFGAASEHPAPRALIFSSRNYDPMVWRCGLVEFEEVIRAIEHVDIIAPSVRRRIPGRALRKADRVARRTLGLELSYTPMLEPVQLTRDYEIFCFCVQNLADLDLLDQLPDWRKRSAKAVCVIEEIYIHLLHDP